MEEGIRLLSKIVMQFSTLTTNYKCLELNQPLRNFRDFSVTYVFVIVHTYRIINRLNIKQRITFIYISKKYIRMTTWQSDWLFYYDVALGHM